MAIKWYQQTYASLVGLLILLSNAPGLAQALPPADPKEKATVITDLLKKADEYSTNAFCARAFSKDALSLMSDDDAAKPGVLLSILRLESLMDPSGVMTDRPLQLAKEALRLAEGQHAPDISRYWLALACYEAQSGKTNLATEHGRMAILNFTKNDPAFKHVQQIMPHYGLPFLLTKNGARDQATKLLQQAVEKIEDIAGKESLESQAQMAEQFQYYVDNKDFCKAIAVLQTILNAKHDYQNSSDQAIADSSVEGRPHYVPSSAILKSSDQILGIIRSAAFESVKSDNCDFAQEVFKKMITMQESKNPPDYNGIAKTWQAAALAYSRAENFEAAYAAYQNQFAAALKAKPGLKKSLLMPDDYYDVLRKLNKQEQQD